MICSGIVSKTTLHANTDHLTVKSKICREDTWGISYSVPLREDHPQRDRIEQLVSSSRLTNSVRPSGPNKSSSKKNNRKTPRTKRAPFRGSFTCSFAWQPDHYAGFESATQRGDQRDRIGEAKRLEPFQLGRRSEADVVTASATVVIVEPGFEEIDWRSAGPKEANKSVAMERGLARGRKNRTASRSEGTATPMVTVSLV
nr:uncharacterized protein LOC109420821 [Aedes albopictus]XP_029715991.1 uncharacterized protein LOC109420821 [Aedes albopictus]